MSTTPTAADWRVKRDAAREAWIQHFEGYFGRALRIDEYRAGSITFKELYLSSLRHVDDMVNEAGRVDPAADPGDHWPDGHPSLHR